MDPIHGPADALAVVRLAASVPLVPETIVILLDDDRRGRTIVVVDDTADPDALARIVEHVGAAACRDGHTGALVVATVRPGGGLIADDDQRWLDASDIADGHGLELIEWFVIGDDGGHATAWCPRDLLAERPRW